MKIHFLPTNASLFRRGLRFEQRAELELEEDPATQPSVELKLSFSVQTAQAQETAPRATTVRFDESKNQAYANDIVGRDECHQTWYSVADIQRFKAQTRQHTRDLRNLEAITQNLENITKDDTSTPSWSKAYSTVYQACCDAATSSSCLNDHAEAERVQQHLPTNVHACNVDIFTCGMEKRAVETVAADIRRRRAVLRKEVFFWQSNAAAMLGHQKGDHPVLPHMIRQACLKVSRPSRLYAQHIAAVSAATEL